MSYFVINKKKYKLSTNSKNTKKYKIFYYVPESWYKIILYRLLINITQNKIQKYNILC